MELLQYRNALKHIFSYGEDVEDRTGVGTRRMFSIDLNYNVSEKHLPIVTSKKIFFKGITTELCWLLKGMTNIDYLKDHSVNIWDEWADEDGGLGPVYGKQLRDLEDSDGNRVDQLENITENIKDNPYSRRHIISLWNPAQLKDMRLPPCHGVSSQFFVDTMDRLHMHMYQRSGDMFLGVPFNITSYSLLLLLVSNQTGLKPGKFYHHIGDAHIYHNHFNAVEDFIKEDLHDLPSVDIDYQDNYEEYEPEHFNLKGYSHGPKISAPVAV